MLTLQNVNVFSLTHTLEFSLEVILVIVNFVNSVKIFFFYKLNRLTSSGLESAFGYKTSINMIKNSQIFDIFATPPPKKKPRVMLCSFSNYVIFHLNRIVRT